ncbi:unnamed protein product [Symbiodinium necroappetens]|uniref:Ubiquitin-like domain-containing protein n=1 Tax=Symbiodinium necroappetens TaxID=1628268 RepID=A0A813BUW1_9DINO|nr:unnamed protein product [Symbiodinium necroappetens]
MTMSISVALLSGRAADIEVEEGSSLEEVQRRAQQMLGVRGRLMASDGSPLKGTGTVLQAGVSDGDSLTLLVPSLRILAGSSSAFAGVLSDDSLVVWGEEAPGDTSFGRQMKNVQQVAATSEAFAALLWDGSVVTWGSRKCGGDSSAVKEELRHVQHIIGTRCAYEDYGDDWANDGAFAAILADGSVVSWGSPACGGDSRSVQHQLKGVKHIATTARSFAALLQDGSVVTWGRDWGSDSSAVQAQLCHVQQIHGSDGAFAAIKDDGSVVTWGSGNHGAWSCHVENQLRDVRHIASTSGAFAALLQSESVVTWGAKNCGGDSRAVQAQLQTVHFLAATLGRGEIIGADEDGAFAAILGDGSVVTWGSPECGGDSRSVQHQLKGVKHIAATARSFAALLQDGSVVTWGNDRFGGDSSSVQDQLHDVQELHGNENLFTVLRSDGSIICWGDEFWDKLDYDDLLEEE